MNNKEGFARNEIAKFRDLAGENYYRVCFSKFFVSNEISKSRCQSSVLQYFYILVMRVALIFNFFYFSYKCFNSLQNATEKDIKIREFKHQLQNY